MKLFLNNPDFNLTDLHTDLERELPYYEFLIISTNVIVAKKEKGIGAYIQLKKNIVNITGDFPTKTGRTLFIFGILLLLVITLAFYFAMFFKKQQAFAVEISSVLDKYYEKTGKKSVVSPVHNTVTVE